MVVHIPFSRKLGSQTIAAAANQEWSDWSKVHNGTESVIHDSVVNPARQRFYCSYMQMVALAGNGTYADEVEQDNQKSPLLLLFSYRTIGLYRTVGPQPSAP